MIGVGGLLATILLPWLASGLLLEWLSGRGPQAQLSRVWRIGAAYLFGMLISGGLLVASASLTGNFQPNGILLFWLVIAVVAGIRLGLRAVQPRPPAWPATLTKHVTPLQWIFIVVVLLLMALRLGGLAIENLHQPMSAWDAWLVWAERARLWFETQSLTPYGSFSQWLNTANPDFHTTNGWEYPHAVSLIHLWAALGLGHWDNALVNLPWLFCLPALAMVIYGTLRLTAVPVWLAVGGAWLLFSLPLLDSHAALAGYAELWLTLAFAVGISGLLVWHVQRNTLVLALALLSLASMPLIKGDPAYVLLALALPALLWLLPWRWRLVLLALAVLGIGLLLTFHGGHIELGRFGGLGLSRASLVVPILGVVSPDLGKMTSVLSQYMFVHDSWHMLWGMTLLALPVLLWRDWRDPMVQVLLLTIATAVTVYGLTYASPKLLPVIANGTVVSRGLMYLTPLAVFAMIHALGIRSRTAEEGNSAGRTARTAEAGVSPLS